VSELSDKKEFHMILPFPPTINHYHLPILGYGKNGIKFPMITIGPEARSYAKEVVATIKDKIGTLTEPLFFEFVGISLYFFPPCLRKRDIDNFTKGVFDGLVAAYILKDDQIIKESHSYWCEKVSFTTHPDLRLAGCCEVRVWVLPDWRPPTYDEIVNYQSQTRLF